MQEMITLNNGVNIPAIGIGGWAQKKQNICDAIDIGYRMIDTAAQYGNESEIGDAISESGVSRSEIFITTKLWTQDIRDREVESALEKSLKNLRTDYVDLYLIHWPAFGFEEAWLKMEKLHKEGKIRAIGISNFEPHHLEELKMFGANIVPVINQIESHPYFSNQPLIDYMSERTVVSEAWCPLGGPQSGEMQDSIINNIAQKYGKSPAQIMLRWHVQRNVIVIPKSSNIVRMKENIDIFDFELDDDDMSQIKKLEQGRRLGAHPDNFNF